MQENHLDLLRLKLVDHESEGLVTLNGLPICGFLGTRGYVPSSVLPNLDGAPQDGMRFVGEDMSWDARSENVAFVCICMKYGKFPQGVAAFNSSFT